MTWGFAFVLTQAIEVPIYLWGMRRTEWAWHWRLLLAFGPSAVTHPVVWFLLPGWTMPMVGYLGYVALAEVFAVLAEALYLSAFGVQNPWRLALAANATSFSVGMALLHCDL